MEIIKNGNTSKIIKCNKCECKFRYSKIDVHYSDGNKEVRCPECGHCNIVGKSLY